MARDDLDLAEALLRTPTNLTVLRRDPGCFMAGVSPHAATIEATLADLDAVVNVASELGEHLDTERSMAIVGIDRVFIEAPATPSPVRYQYLMHRGSDFTHEEYLARYESIHSEFGLRTPNIEGYVQLHVDLDASSSLGEATGLRAAPCDSMSELHLRSVEHFVQGIIAHPEVGREAQEDEERFVDRSRSFGFAHRLV